MRKKLLPILIVFSTIVIYAEDFAPIGATWHYSYQTFKINRINGAMPSYYMSIKITSTSDLYY